MRNANRLGWFMLGALTTLVLIAIPIALVVWHHSAPRPPAPPEDAAVAFPWGAIDLGELQADPNSALQRSLADSFRAEPPNEFDADGDGVRTYPLLVLSAGGSTGAFGSGFLCGWAAAGTRPDFKVVTGVSTGALQATFAFLGPEYDDELRTFYTKYETSDIHTKRSFLSGVLEDAIWDSAPLAQLIARYVDDEMLRAVAAKHATGHRLFVGTTNVDTSEFMIWDMGAIAASGRPDAVEHYGKILLASSSVPVLFPPVYFPVEASGQTCYEMHVDGGTYAQVFFRGFLLDFEDAFADAGIDPSRAKAVLYVIRNGRLVKGHTRINVKPRAVAIASTTIDGLFKIAIGAGLYRIYVLANRYGIDFNLTQIPDDCELVSNSMIFEPDEMQQLFDLGYRLARDGYDWHKYPPGLDPDEIFRDE